MANSNHLNIMARLLYPGRIANFREEGAKDKKKRKRRGLLGAIGTGTQLAIGGGILASTAASAIDSGRAYGKAARSRGLRGLEYARGVGKGVLRGAGLGLLTSTYKIPKLVLLGAGAGAAAYGAKKLIDKVRNQNQEKKA